MTLAQDLVRTTIVSNPSLALTKFAPPLKSRDDWPEHLRRISEAKLPSGYADYFSRLRARTAAGPSFRRVLLAQALAPTICGMGERTPGENGLTLHPVYGVPYLPGTSLKGILRAWVLSQNWGKDWQEGGVRFRSLFGQGGHQGEAGVVDILDALPVPKDKLFTVDVLTPHFADYYHGKSGPLGWQGPNPVRFLVASQGVHYRLVLEGASEWLDKAAEWLALSLSERGVGAKSRAGYGRFACKALQPGHPDETAAARRNTAARQTIPERLANDYEKYGEAAVRSEVEKWLLGESVNESFTALLPSPPGALSGTHLTALRFLAEKWPFRRAWEDRIRNRKADERKKVRARRLIEGWDRIFGNEPG